MAHVTPDGMVVNLRELTRQDGEAIDAHIAAHSLRKIGVTEMRAPDACCVCVRSHALIARHTRTAAFTN